MNQDVTGFDPPNFTQLPNIVLDNIQQLSLAELKVMLAVCRRTFGYQTGSALLSLSYIGKLTGLSHQSVATGIAALLKLGWILRQKAGYTFAYGVNCRAVGGPPEQPIQNLDQSKILTEPIQNLDQQPIQNLDTLKKGKKKNSKERPEVDITEWVAAHPMLRASPEFMEALSGFAEHRRKKRSPLTERALKLIFKDFPTNDPLAAAAMLDQTVANGWTGVFEVRNRKTNNAHSNNSQRNTQNGFGLGVNEPNDYK